MVFVACGLNHKTAPLPVREKVAMHAANHNFMLMNLLDLPQIGEAALLSTCNRTEIYCETTKPQILAEWLSDAHMLPKDSLLPYFYLHEGEAAIKHTLRVASGLDSMMLGEPQILGQMKQAYQQACQLGSIKSQLRPVFQYVFRASKRIRTLSGIGTNPVSIAYMAVQLCEQLLPNLSQRRVFLIGSGETSSLVAKYLHQKGVQEFLISSRTLESAQKLADFCTGTTIPISDIPQSLHLADVVISATACPLPFINQSMVRQALNLRQQRPMLFLDLAVPRDIESDVGELEQIHLFNIDDLQIMIEKGMRERRHAALQAEQLIESELDNYLRWHRSLQAKELICHYRDNMQDLAQQEVERAMNKLSQGFDHESVIQELSTRLVNKLTHHPSTGLRKAAWDGREDLLDLVKYLFSATTKYPTPYEEIA